MFFLKSIVRPPKTTRTDTLFPYTPLFRSPPDWIIVIVQFGPVGELEHQDPFGRVAVIIARPGIARRDTDRFARSAIAIGDTRLAVAIAHGGDRKSTRLNSSH